MIPPVSTTPKAREGTSLLCITVSPIFSNTIVVVHITRIIGTFSGLSNTSTTHPPLENAPSNKSDISEWKKINDADGSKLLCYT